MNTYDQKQAARKARLEAASGAASERANAAFSRADMREEVSGIPFGQPILVGHHSEGKHRRALARADNAMRRGVAESERAQELTRKAKAVGRGGISSDDPDAVAQRDAERMTGWAMRNLGTDDPAQAARARMGVKSVIASLKDGGFLT